MVAQRERGGEKTGKFELTVSESKAREVLERRIKSRRFTYLVDTNPDGSSQISSHVDDRAGRIYRVQGKQARDIASDIMAGFGCTGPGRQLSPTTPAPGITREVVEWQSPTSPGLYFAEFIDRDESGQHVGSHLSVHSDLSKLVATQKHIKIPKMPPRAPQNA